MNKGSCLCGAIRFETAGPLAESDACHCSQCRRWSGHFWASADIRRADLTLHGGEHVRWFRSSEKVRRGSCSHCGSALFWEAIGRDKIGVALGAFDKPTGARLAKHIFVADKGDYYDIADGVPQHRQ